MTGIDDFNLKISLKSGNFNIHEQVEFYAQFTVNMGMIKVYKLEASIIIIEGIW